MSQSPVPTMKVLILCERFGLWFGIQGFRVSGSSDIGLRIIKSYRKRCLGTCDKLSAPRNSTVSNRRPCSNCVDNKQ